MTSRELASMLLANPDAEVIGVRVTQGHADDNDGGDDAPLVFVKPDTLTNRVWLHFE
jgi:hypothetical protein